VADIAINLANNVTKSRDKSRDNIICEIEGKDVPAERSKHHHASMASVLKQA
jgi:hypothetical protein